MNGIAMMGVLGALWGGAGITALLLSAVIRLSTVSIEIMAFEINNYHLTLLALNVAFMAYSEGYRGFQCSFAPRAAARMRYLLHHPRPLRVLLAPLFCMSFFDAPRQRLWVSYGLTCAIVCMIIMVHYALAQPWRGIVDAGVVVGLIWGLLSFLVASWRALTRSDYSISPELLAGH